MTSNWHVWHGVRTIVHVERKQQWQTQNDHLRHMWTAVENADTQPTKQNAVGMLTGETCVLHDDCQRVKVTCNGDPIDLQIFLRI